MYFYNSGHQFNQYHPNLNSIMKRDINRAVFYSKQDLSKDRNLQNAEPIIEKFGSEKHYEINDILELHQIKLYFDNELYHSDWCAETQEKYIKTVDSFWNTINVKGNAQAETP